MFEYTMSFTILCSHIDVVMWFISVPQVKDSRQSRFMYCSYNKNKNK